MINKVINKISRSVLTIINKQNFIKYLQDVPNNYKDLFLFSYTNKLTDVDKNIGSIIEELRNKVESLGDSEVHSFGSPHSDKPLLDNDGKVIPGILKKGQAKNAAKTGTKILGGIQLKMLVDAYGSADIFELGTNAGLSGCYFLSSVNTKELVTVEGSEDLCKIASQNLKSISDKFDVLNTMFDSAIDAMIAKNRTFDIIFLDGQHEYKATMYYTDLLIKILKPGGMIIFDDIYWSEGMNKAWNELCDYEQFTMTFDIGTRGICFLRENDEQTLHYSISKYKGKPLLQRPGW